MTPETLALIQRGNKARLEDITLCGQTEDTLRVIKELLGRRDRRLEKLAEALEEIERLRRLRESDAERTANLLPTNESSVTHPGRLPV